MTTRWNTRYASRTERMSSSAIRELLKITQNPGVISFAGGLPAPELFPVERLREATERALTQKSAISLQYGTTEGYNPLRELILQNMARYGIHCTLDNVMITGGSQQALDLIGKVLVDEGDTILVEAPTYLGALQAWAPYGPNYVAVDSDEEGMRVDALKQAIWENEVKFIYAIPNFQNPSGVTMSAERRRALDELADENNIPIIEDDPYGQLRYEGRHEKPLIVIDAARQHECTDCMITGNVLYLSTFSKTLCPGLRIAWVVGPQDIISKLVQAKQGADLHTSTFAQVVTYEAAKDGFVDAHVAMLRKVYRERRDLMLHLLETQFAELGVTWNRPQGGLFLWARFPDGLNTTELLPKAVAKKVAFVPGAPFYPGGGGHNAMRLNFSNATSEQIEEGMGRLLALLKEELVSA